MNIRLGWFEGPRDLSSLCGAGRGSNAHEGVYMRKICAVAWERSVANLHIVLGGVRKWGSALRLAIPKPTVVKTVQTK
jgi:hypothetical protein